MTMLVIDSRERAGSKLVGLVEAKAKSMNISFEKKWIEVGDYVYDDVCFEAKSAIDFLGSVMSKRLWTQIDNMDRCYKTNIVIIYGSMADAINNLKSNTKSKTPEPARSIMLSNKFLGGIGKIILDTDVKPVWVRNEEDAAKIITAVCKMKPIDREAIRPEVFRRIATDDLRIDVLIGIKGVSAKKAKELLKKFGSISEIAHHSAIEIAEIEGIGSTVANRILTVLESERRVRI
jgi:ERCC4-type nuclease